MNRKLQAVACLGTKEGSSLCGTVKFYQMEKGTLVEADIHGLPRAGFFAFHIHEGNNCGGVGFANTLGHYNPTGEKHPDHAGDLPPLLSCDGNAYMQVLTDRFLAEEVMGRTVVIHSGTDDFQSQPAGNAGQKIACGVIRACCRGII